MSENDYRASGPRRYRRHNCGAKHRTVKAMAKCIWPRAAWIHGTGPLATVAYCRVTTVILHHTLADAQEAMSIMASGCGGRCHGDHHLVELVLS